LNNQIIRNIPIITFHKVDTAFEWGVTRVTPCQFEKIIKYLAGQGYQTISLDQAYKSADLPDKPIIITFDDGYESLYSYALPILKKYSFSATVFLISGYIGKMNKWDVNLGGKIFPHLTKEQIDTMIMEGWEIGSHTIHHPDLTRISPAQIRTELFDSKQYLENLLGKEIKSISFPFGRYNRDILNQCANAGYETCCAFWRKSWVNEIKEPFVFERKAYYLFDTLHDLRAKCGNGVFTKFEKIKLRLINFFSHGTAIVKPYKF